MSAGRYGPSHCYRARCLYCGGELLATDWPTVGNGDRRTVQHLNRADDITLGTHDPVLDDMSLQEVAR